MAPRRLLQLRYPASCDLCGSDLPARTQAWWDSASHTATCLPCDLESPADPFAGVDPEMRGIAGGSAQVEHDRRAAKHNHNRRSTEAWQKGADGERHLSALLHKEAGRGQLTVLDDLIIPGSKANIDHIAIAPSGIYVIDAKNYSGTVDRKAEGFGRRRTERLIVKGRDRTKLATAMERQTGAVRAALVQLDPTADFPVMPVLCFVGKDNWGLIDPAFTIGNVHVLWPRALRKLLRRGGSLDGSTRAKLARLLSTQLSPASK
jgi:hypothetical protein